MPGWKNDAIVARSIRHERELTQGQFVELVEISDDFLSLIERGVNAPSFEVPTARKLQLAEVPIIVLDHENVQVA